MKRKITIKGRTGLFDIPSFVVVENDVLNIIVDIPDEIRVYKYRLVIRHGNLKKTFTLYKGMTAMLEPDWLNANNENLEFAFALLDDRDRVIKDDYQIEPLKMETLEGDFKFSAQVQALMKWQEEHGKKLAELEARFSTYENSGVNLSLVDEEEN